MHRTKGLGSDPTIQRKRAVRITLIQCIIFVISLAHPPSSSVSVGNRLELTAPTEAKSCRDGLQHLPLKRVRGWFYLPSGGGAGVDTSFSGNGKITEVLGSQLTGKGFSTLAAVFPVLADGGSVVSNNRPAAHCLMGVTCKSRAYMT